ncbi:hypothetical protein [Mycobacterium sp. TY815]|uniref:hypothetical protein n=1 Tax=Mycobacterium sp. TY815 TaxID=3050581 RepID=UPI0027423C73|nr:hypothetical protein [Mycobacterium sp. TY815]MDP7707319.1 hypothetical protein [Mycobacterium sp. TY815]
MTTLSERTEDTVTETPGRTDEDETTQQQPQDIEELEDVKDRDESADEPITDDEPDDAAGGRKIAWSRVVAYGLLPALALLLALTAGYFKWVAVSGTDVARARTESMRVASEDAVAMLSYNPDTAEKQLTAARDRLTGDFKDAYTALTRQVVIPGAKEKRISAVAKVNAAASVSATAEHAVVLLFVDQTVTIGDGGAPTDTQPVIRVTLEKVDGRWLVSHFDPV